MPLHGGERLRRVCEGNDENKHPLSGFITTSIATLLEKVRFEVGACSR